MKKVFILSSSPRRGGNSDTLCNQFMEGAIESGNCVEKVSLREKKIGYCTGCGGCKTDAHCCVQKDDAVEIIEKMIAADVIVFATPVYFYSMSAQLKTLIDRLSARYKQIHNKEIYFILTAADTSTQKMETVVAGFRGLMTCLKDSTEKGILYGLGASKSGDVKELPILLEAYKMGQKV